MNPPLTLFGIPGCDTVRRARAWLLGSGCEHRFHDFKKQGVPADRLATWVAALGWETLLNRRGSTWRQLDALTLASAVDAAGATALMQARPSVIRRPVVEWPDGRISVGFDAADWAARIPPRC